MSKPNPIRKITKPGSSSSLSIVIPAELLRELGWHRRQRLQLKKVPGGILIHDAKTKKRKS